MLCGVERKQPIVKKFIEEVLVAKPPSFVPQSASSYPNANGLSGASEYFNSVPTCKSENLSKDPGESKEAYLGGSDSYNGSSYYSSSTNPPPPTTSAPNGYGAGYPGASAGYEKSGAAYQGYPNGAAYQPHLGPHYSPYHHNHYHHQGSTSSTSTSNTSVQG